MAVNLRELKEKIDKDGLYTIKEVANAINVSVDTVRYWTYSGKFPNKRKIGRRVYIPGADIWAIYKIENNEYKGGIDG